MAKVKKMAFGGMGNIVKNVGNSVKQATVQNKMLNAAQSAADASKFKPLPPGSIGFPGGPGGKTMYNTGPTPGNVEQNYRGIPGLVNATAPIGNIANRFTKGPAPMPTKGAPNTFAGALLGGGAAPSKPVGPVQGIGAAMSKPNVGTGPIGNVRNVAGLGNMLGKSLGMKKGGKVSSASKRADGIAQRGKTRA